MRYLNHVSSAVLTSQEAAVGQAGASLYWQPLHPIHWVRTMKKYYLCLEKRATRYASKQIQLLLVGYMGLGQHRGRQLAAFHLKRDGDAPFSASWASLAELVNSNM